VADLRRELFGDVEITADDMSDSEPESSDWAVTTEFNTHCKWLFLEPCQIFEKIPLRLDTQQLLINRSGLISSLILLRVFIISINFFLVKLPNRYLYLYSFKLESQPAYFQFNCVYFWTLFILSRGFDSSWRLIPSLGNISSNLFAHCCFKVGYRIITSNFIEIIHVYNYVYIHLILTYKAKTTSSICPFVVNHLDNFETMLFFFYEGLYLCIFNKPIDYVKIEGKLRSLFCNKRRVIGKLMHIIIYDENKSVELISHFLPMYVCLHLFKMQSEAPPSNAPLFNTYSILRDRKPMIQIWS
jgi:hypothetical protein